MGGLLAASLVGLALPAVAGGWLCPGALVQVVAPQERLTKRILFLVDTSGSMDGPAFGRALSAVKLIAGQPVDDMQIAVVAFDDDVSRWPGLPEDDVPPGWAALPSLTAIHEASAWLAEQGAQGNTLAIPGIERALAESRDELSVVLVSDGQFHAERSVEVLGALSAGQAARREAGLRPVVFMSYGVGERCEVLARLGAIGKGGYFQEAEAPLAEVLPPDPPAIQPAPVQPPVQRYR